MQNTNTAKLSDYIKINDILEIKISSYSEWITNSVKGINDDNDILEIGLMDIFLNMNLMIDDEIHCKLIKDNTVYIFEGKVIDIGIMDSKKIVIKINNVKKYNNERQHNRYTVNLCGRLIFDNNENSTFVAVKNLSVDGISVVSKEQIKLNEDVDIDIVLWKNKVLSIQGKVVRIFKIGNIYKYGIVIEYIESNSKELLNQFIDELKELEISQIFN